MPSLPLGSVGSVARGRHAVLLIVLALGSGCAHARKPPETTGVVSARDERADPPAATQRAASEIPEGVFHVVRAGQTLWRIARAYGVPLRDLMAANGIEDADRLAAGRALFVPGGRHPLEVAPHPAPPPAVPAVGGGSASKPATGFSWPIPGGTVLSRFGDPRRGRGHSGLDIRGPRGGRVIASRTGVVVFSGPTGNGYGRIVVIDHEDGFQTVYAHNDEELVPVGARVRDGEPIALVGRTGNATTDHCHFEIRKDRVPVDPMLYLGRARRAEPEIAGTSGPGDRANPARVSRASAVEPDGVERRPRP